MNKSKLSILKLSLFVITMGSLIYLMFFYKADTGKDKQTASRPPAAVTTAKTTTSATQKTETQPPAGADGGIAAAPMADMEGKENRVQTVESSQAEIDGHRFLTENAEYELYLKQENLSVIVRNKNTGAVMYSTVKDPAKSNEEWTNFVQSGIVMEYLVGTNIVTYRADMYSGDPEKDVKIKDDGFIATVSYPKLGISYLVDATLTDSGLQVEIPKDKVVETNDMYRVSGFYVYPFLGYSHLGERQGYMFIPDGSGALIHLKDNNGKYKQPYSEMVYGSNPGIDDSYVLSLFNKMNPVNDPEKILAPVFGMVQTDSKIGYLGIIEEGDASAKIEAYPSGAILPYNWITSKFIYRQFYNQPTSKDSGTIVIRQKNKNNFNIKVRYDFVSGEQADYTGLATTYRDYLLGEELVVKKDDPEFNARVDLLGADKENGLISKKSVPMTTFGQAGQIFTKLKKEGVENILSIYKGWQKDGVYGGLPIAKFKTDSSLGSVNELAELIDKSKKQNVELYLDQDALRINAEENGTSNYKVMKKFNKRTHTEKVYGKVYKELNYLAPSSSVAVLKRMEKEYTDNKIENIMVSGISNTLFSHSQSGKEYDRVSTREVYESIVKEYNQSFDLLLEQPYSYFWKYTGAMIDMPAASSDYVFTDESIPFYSIALKGIMPMYSEYVNFQANQKEFFLQLVEQGLLPSFYITHEDPANLLNTNSSDIYSSRFDRYEDTIVSYYTDLKKVHDQTKGALIADYERINGVTKVTYDNGTVVYVNYTNDDAAINGQTIGKLSYKVVQTR